VSENETPMIDPHGDAGDVISDVPELSVEEVEKRIGAREAARARRRVAATTPTRIRTAPSNRRAILWRDSATILIFVIVALLAARFLLGGNQSGIATASPTPFATGVEITEAPLDTGFHFSQLPTIGPPVDPSNRINATPTPIPVITPAPPTPPTAVKAVAGNQAADVSWTAPLSNGGSEIKTYVVTSSPGGKTCSAGTGIHHCTVSHLTNGTSYTFTVTATNSVGTSPPSAPSNAVVPSTTPTKTPGPGATPSPTKPPPTLPPAPFAGFSCSQSTTQPLTEDFTSTSSGSITAYLWDFGDGGGSISANTSHLYQAVGDYTVTLTVTGPGGSDSQIHICSVN